MMHGISKDKLKELSEKWMKGTLSEEERSLFESWYNQHSPSSMEWPGDETEQELHSRIYDRINKEVRTVRMPHWWRVALPGGPRNTGTENPLLPRYALPYTRRRRSLLILSGILPCRTARTWYCRQEAAWIIRNNSPAMFGK